ncbi:MAG: tetratricopeptide repeat protein [Vicinamibacteria bacterium]|nr:tetratricopeptide repeat protein [Vicinamibacteria bacterium]
MRILIVAATALIMAAGPTLAEDKVEETVAKAKMRVEKGKPLDAVKMLQKLVEKNPASIEARRALFDVQIRARQRNEAGAAVQAWAQSAQGVARSHALATLASYELLRGPASAALAHAQEAVKIDPNAAALAVLARAQARIDDPKIALETAQRALQVSPQSADAHEAHGAALLVLGRTGEAVAAFRKAAELVPDCSRLRANLALALVAAGKAAEAVETAQAAVDADTDTAEGYAALALALVSANKNTWGDAIGKAQEAKLIDGSSPLALTILGKIFYEGANVPWAKGAFEDALKVDPNYADAAVALVSLLQRDGKTDEALVLAQKYAQAMPHAGPMQKRYGELLLRKADALLEKGDPNGAVEKRTAAVEPLEAAIKKLPDDHELQFEMGLAYSFTGEVDKAVSPFARAVSLAPANLDYRIAYGLALGRNDQYAEGIAELQKVVANPQYKGAEAWINLGYLYREMTPKQTADAVDAYRKALTIDAKSVPASQGLAWSLFYAKRYDEAITAARQAVVLDKTFERTEALLVASSIYFRDAPSKRMAEAQKALDRARSIIGADNALIKQIADAIDIAKRGGITKVKELQDVIPIDMLMKGLQRGSVADKRRALFELKKHGCDGAPYVAFGCRDPDIGVRETALRVLKSMGRQACNADALKQMENALAVPPPCPQCKPADEARVIDVTRGLRDIVIMCKGG